MIQRSDLSKETLQLRQMLTQKDSQTSCNWHKLKIAFESTS
jgi:hypothetical protein